MGGVILAHSHKDATLALDPWTQRGSERSACNLVGVASPGHCPYPQRTRRCRDGPQDAGAGGHAHRMDGLLGNGRRRRHGCPHRSQRRTHHGAAHGHPRQRAHGDCRRPGRRGVRSLAGRSVHRRRDRGRARRDLPVRGELTQRRQQRRVLHQRVRPGGAAVGHARYRVPHPQSRHGRRAGVRRAADGRTLGRDQPQQASLLRGGASRSGERDL